jgi:hypothetical protein
MIGHFTHTHTHTHLKMNSLLDSGWKLFYVYQTESARINIPYVREKHLKFTRLCCDECNFTPDKLLGLE